MTASPLSPRQQKRVDKATAKAARPWVLRHWFITGGAALIVLIIIIVATSSGSSNKSKNSSLTSPATTTSPAGPTKADSTPTPTPKPTPTKPSLTGQQQQAVSSAQNYLSLGSGFSKAGLIQQLSSKDGDGFSVADATVAVDSLNIDYDAQAVLAAKNYLSLGSGFSHAGMVQQLESADGSDFTPAQAEYGADHDGS